MKYQILISIIIISIFFGCSEKKVNLKGDITAKEILGNSKYQALSAGAYRHINRDSVPSVVDIKEDLKLTAALSVKLLRTYNTQHYAQAENLLQAIKELKEADPNFEMYVMLGAWIQCDGAWSSKINHNLGNEKNNKAEIDKAVALAQKYPTIVKMIAVGNEAMINWASGYYVSPKIILKWVNHLQELKEKGVISKGIWITSSDNYEAWGGGAKSYQTKGLEDLIKAVDFISLHTYPYHATYHQPLFWGIPEDEMNLSDIKKIDKAMGRATKFAINQYQTTADYVASLGIKKPIHIGETGWATIANRSYGKSGSQAADEYKEKLFYDQIRDWTNKNNISCFYFKLMDERWKAKEVDGSENNFGLIKMNGQAKYALWDEVDKGTFDGIIRNGLKITKTFNGNKAVMMKTVFLPPTLKEIGIIELHTVNKDRKITDAVTEEKYIVAHNELIPNATNKMTYPSSKLEFMAIDGTCKFKMQENYDIEVVTGTGQWWAAALKISDIGKGENLSKFDKGFLHFELKGDTKSIFYIGFQTGDYTKGTLKFNGVDFGTKSKRNVTNSWKKHRISMQELNKSNQLDDVTSVLSIKGINGFDGKNIYIKNVYYSQK